MLDLCKRWSAGIKAFESSLKKKKKKAKVGDYVDSALEKKLLAKLKLLDRNSENPGKQLPEESRELLFDDSLVDLSGKSADKWKKAGLWSEREALRKLINGLVHEIDLAVRSSKWTSFDADRSWKVFDKLIKQIRNVDDGDVASELQRMEDRIGVDVLNKLEKKPEQARSAYLRIRDEWQKEIPRRLAGYSKQLDVVAKAMDRAGQCFPKL